MLIKFAELVDNNLMINVTIDRQKDLNRLKCLSKHCLKIENNKSSKYNNKNIIFG